MELARWGRVDRRGSSENVVNFDGFKKNYVKCVVVNINPRGKSDYYFDSRVDTVKPNRDNYLEVYKLKAR